MTWTDYKSITGFAACVYNCKWWVGCVLSNEEETNTVKIILLHSTEPSPSHMYKHPASSQVRHFDER
jgi:hypothetical protein